MKKWIIGIVIVAVIALLVWYYKPFQSKDQPTKDEGEEQPDVGNQTMGSNREDIQVDVPLAKANRSTLLQLQRELNLAIDLGARNGIEVPAKLTEDGKLGAKTKDAIRFAYATSKGFQESRIVRSEEITWDVTAVTLKHVRHILTAIATAIAQKRS